MKKILLGCLFAVSASAFAHGPHGYYHGYHYHNHNNWVAPLIVGGVIGYTISRPPAQVYNPPLTTIPSIQTQTCTPWVEVQNIDGSITRTRTCTN